MNLESEIGKQQAAQGKTTTVAVTTPTTTTTGQRKYPPKGEPRRIHPWSICQEVHLTYQCPLLKDPTICSYLKQRKKEHQQKPPTSIVVITDVTTTGCSSGCPTPSSGHPKPNLNANNTVGTNSFGHRLGCTRATPGSDDKGSPSTSNRIGGTDSSTFIGSFRRLYTTRMGY